MICHLQGVESKQNKRAMLGSKTGKQEEVSEHDGLQLGDMHFPPDVWTIILANAAAPLRQLPKQDGLSHAARWLDLALVCKQ